MVMMMRRSQTKKIKQLSGQSGSDDDKGSLKM